MMFLFLTPILELTKEVGRITATFSEEEQRWPLSAEIKATNISFFLQQMDTLRGLGLTLSSQQCGRIVLALREENVTIGAFCEKLRALYDRVLDECGDACFLALSRQESAYYEPARPLCGIDVQSKFPKAIYEIDEAGKCLGLERSTASAFHSIRCLEVGIKAASRCLGIPDPTRAVDRSWFNMLKAIKGEIDRRWPNSSDRMSGDGQFFDEAYAALAAMQNPWRNATMHLDQKYTPDEAKHILDVVIGFMKKAASRMDEQGEPKA